MDGLNSLSKYLKLKDINIYGAVPLLHSRFTVVILMSCIFFLSTKQYFGDPISCMGGNDRVDLIETFCWTMGTFILVRKNGTLFEDPTNIGYDTRRFIGYGLGPENSRTQRLYFRYYQWVILLLFQHTVFFFFPSFLWKIWEGKRLETVCCEMAVPFVEEETFQKKKSWLFNYFNNDNTKIHKSYAIKYLICESLNLVTCLFNMWTLHIAFNNFWTDFAPSIFYRSSYNWDYWNYMSATIFPKITKCIFTKYGSSGSIESRDIYCVLPLNILNEKIFAFLGIWYILLALLSSLVLLMYSALLASKKLRIAVIHKKASFIRESEIRKILDDFTFGDWIFLNKVAVNVNPSYFSDLMRELKQSSSAATV